MCSAALHTEDKDISIIGRMIAYITKTVHSRRTSLFGTWVNAGLHTIVQHKTKTNGFQHIERGKVRKTHVRPVERLMPARTVVMRMASKPRCTSFPSISGLCTDGRLSYVMGGRDVENARDQETKVRLAHVIDTHPSATCLRVRVRRNNNQPVACYYLYEKNDPLAW